MLKGLSFLVPLLLAHGAVAGMMGTHIQLDVYDDDGSPNSLHHVFGPLTATIVDPGVEISLPGQAIVDFSDVGMTFDLLLTDWKADVISFVWVNDTPGAFTGLSLISSTFPAPAFGPVWSNDGTTLTLRCCVVHGNYPTTNFEAVFSGASPTESATPEPGSILLMVAGAAALIVRRKIVAGCIFPVRW